MAALDKLASLFKSSTSMPAPSAKIADSEPAPAIDILINTSRNPVPGGAITDTFVTKDGIRLRYTRWKPATKRRRGTVCLFTGRGEFIEKYFEIIADLRRRGFSVAIMDWRGQGGSQRLLPDRFKGHVVDFSDYEEDVKSFMREIVLPDCPAPFFALGHSMGAQIILRFAHQPNCWFDRMILTSPLLEFVNLPAPYKFIQHLTEAAALLGFADAYVPFGHYAKNKRIPVENKPFEGNLLTADHVRYMRGQSVLRSAPHLGIGSPTIGWVHAAFQSMKIFSMQSYAESIHVPMLIMSAGHDEVVSNQAIHEFATEARMSKLIVMPNSKHEIMQEREILREQFWAAFDTFIPGTQYDYDKEQT